MASTSTPATDRLGFTARMQGWALRPRRFSPALFATLAIATVIGALVPFDVLFNGATRGSPLLRAGLIAAMVLAGTACAHRLGLRLEGHGVKRPLLLGLLMAILVASYVVVIDAFAFRAQLADQYVDFMHTPLSGRYAYFMLRAFNENVIYRLFAFTALTTLIAPLAGPRKVPFAAVFAVMVAVQVINIAANVVLLSGEPLTAVALTYDVLRYVVNGVIWACLFWRCGFFVAEVASVGCHIFLQPALGYLLA